MHTGYLRETNKRYTHINTALFKSLFCTKKHFDVRNNNVNSEIDNASNVIVICNGYVFYLDIVLHMLIKHQIIRNFRSYEGK